MSIQAKYPVTENETDPVLLDLDPIMIKALRDSPDKMTVKNSGVYGPEGGLHDLLQQSDFSPLIKKHNLALFNGPMVGSVTPTSAKFWVRTAGEAQFQVVIGNKKSNEIVTKKADDYTGVVEITGLKPFTQYQYEVLVNGKLYNKAAFHFSTYPTANMPAKYNIAFGACSRYIPINEPIWNKVAESEPLAYLGLGDNVYIDATHQQDTQRLHYYRRMLREEYRDFISQTSMYAVWDDHDFGLDDAYGGDRIAPWKIKNLNVFKQNWNNPFYGNKDKPTGTYHNFTIGQVEVFMTDGRFNRTELTKVPGTMLGAEQKAWLLKSLKASTATFKIIASGTMWTEHSDKKGRDSWSGPRFRAERDEIFEFIKKHKINGVVLLAGDRHRTEIWKNSNPGSYPLYEFLSGKVTNLHTHPTKEKALWSYNKGNFWGDLSFDFSLGDPTITFTAINQDGESIKDFTLKLSEISH